MAEASRAQPGAQSPMGSGSNVASLVAGGGPLAGA
jgi:hypothetical protein